ncbi:MAG TPA: choice-of-anchor tandem repeat GloVer-containing protein [Terriglobales bacterium]
MTLKMLKYHTSRLFWLCFLALMLVATAFAEWNESVLYSFQGGNSDGAVPVGGIVFDSKGNLYGATAEGGGQCPPLYCGTVFHLTPPAKNGDPWTETVLYVFKGVGPSSADGSNPGGGLVMDSSGNLYGTTAYGGTGNCVLLGTKVGCGTVYELSPPAEKGGNWTERILYNFQSGKDGYLPIGDLTFDAVGNLYGATVYGGGYGSCNSPYYQYCGTVFRLHPPKQKDGKWSERVLYSFKGGTAGKGGGDGAEPNGGLVLDSKGSIYGTTYYGGDESGECDGGDTGTGCGTAFMLSPPSKMCKPWTETTLHRFNVQEGATPAASVVLDEDGNLYGTVYAGGNQGSGGVFELTSPAGKSHVWTEKVLYLFEAAAGGAGPEAGLVIDGAGSIYGTTYYGSGDELQGSVFRLKAPHKSQGARSIDYLHGFVRAPDGLFPAAGLVLDGAGSLYSTTQEGGIGTSCGHGGCGTVFEVSP